MTDTTTNPTPSRTVAEEQPGRRYLAPGWTTRRLLNPLVAWLVRRGMSLQGAAVLEVAGRHTGTTRTTPVNPLTLDGRIYLLAPRGDTEWSRNLRAAGAAQLVTGRHRRRAITVSDVPAADRAGVLRAYVARWGSQVRGLLPALPGDPTAADYEAVAGTLPMFLVDQ